jgi:Type II secretory pathway, component ExeA (predicted ATPase)
MTQVIEPENNLEVESPSGVRKTPFGVTPDPQFFYANTLYLKSLADLSQGIKAKKGLMVLTGEVGMGKTILVRKLMCDLQSVVKFIFISCSHLTSHRLLEIIAQNLGIVKKKTRFDLAEELREYLLQQAGVGRMVTLILDESQNLSDKDFETLCSLSNLETDNEKLLQIVLAGQPELIAKLSNPSLRQVRQRVVIQHCVTGLQTENEVKHYIRHRLVVADYHDPEIFSEEAVEAIWQYSSGTPRLVNVICDKSLELMCEAGAEKVASEFVTKSASEFQLNKELPISRPKNSEILGEAITTADSNGRANGRKVETLNGIKTHSVSPHPNGIMDIPQPHDQVSFVPKNPSGESRVQTAEAEQLTKAVPSKNQFTSFGETRSSGLQKKHIPNLTRWVNRMKPIRFQTSIGIKWKIAGAFSLLTLVLLSFLTAGLYHLTSRALREQLDKRALAIASNLSDASAGYMLGNDLLSLNTVLQKYTFTEGVAYAFIRNPGGAIVAHTLGEFPPALRQTLPTGRESTASRRETSLQAKPVHEISVPVLGGQLGTVHVGFWEDAMTQEIQQGLFPAMGIIAAVALLGTVLSFIVAKRIAKPITRLTQVAEKISKGDLEPSGEYPISRDEIGDLGRSVERMRASLKAAMSRLAHESV